MTQVRQHKHWWHPISKKLAATRPVVWFISKTLHHFDKLIYRITDGKTTAAALLSGLPVVTLTTTGAKSGKPRSVPLIAFPDGEKLVFVASNWGQQTNPSWYYNLRANPELTVSSAGQDRKYTAYEANGSEKERYWQQVVDTHAAYAAYKQRANGRQIPLVVCVPEENPLSDRRTVE